MILTKTIDPTRTVMIRRRFVSEMQRRFNSLAQAVKKLVVTEDAFGLKVNPMMILQADQAWRFATDSGKIDAYKKWLQKEVDSKILTVSGTGEPWTSPYIESGYKKGVERAYIDVNKRFDFYSGSQQEFLRDAFNSPEMMSKVQLLMTRSFEELKGVTAAMSQQMGRILSDGLIKGEGPAKIARSLTDNIKKLTRTRANVIARTEIIHAHAEGQLDSFQRLNVEEVSAMVEWSTAGDDRVCEQCSSMEGETYTIDEARGQIPLHPNCRCAWIPSDMQPKTVPGKRASGPIGAPTTKPDIITRVPTKKAPQAVPGTPKPALKTKPTSGTTWADKSKEVARPLDDPRLPAWAQGKGAPNPIFSSKEDALKSLSKFDDKDLILSSFPGGIDLSKSGAKLYKGQQISIDKLYHSIQGDVSVVPLRKYLALNPEKYKEIEVIYRNGRYMILDGHHRVEAARALGQKFINAKVWSREVI